MLQEGPSKPHSPLSLGRAGQGSTEGPPAAGAEKQSQRNAAGPLGLGTGIGVWKAAGAGRAVGFAFKLCQLTSEAFLSQAS